MRKTSIAVIPLALLLVLAVTAGRGSSANQEESLAQVVAGLRGQLDELSTRMERLEQATDSYYPGLSDTDTSQVTAARPQRSLGLPLEAPGAARLGARLGVRLDGRRSLGDPMIARIGAQKRGAA